LCADVLEAEGFKDVKVTEGTGDWKMDIVADELLVSQAGDYEILHFMVQCKHYVRSGKNVRPNEIGEMFPYLYSTEKERLLIITDTDLTAQAKKEIDSFNKKNFVSNKKAVYWSRRELENRLLRHRWILDKYFPKISIELPRRNWKKSNPYRLLEPFEERDCDYFFGRDHDVVALSELVHRHQMVILFGESGVGKTSLLNAGLSPLLEKEGWIIVSTRCLDNPVQNIRNQVLRNIRNAGVEKAKLEMLQHEKGFDSFLFQLANLANVQELKLLIVLDQMEELFTLCGDRTRKDFEKGLTSLLTLHVAKGKLTILFSLRSDYLGNLRSWARQNHALDSVFSWDGLHWIGRFSRESAIQAIVNPARKVGATYEKALIERLISDLLQLGNGLVYQPYLQIVCFTLFDQARKKNTGHKELEISLEL
jgi:hypothetical protein